MESTRQEIVIVGAGLVGSMLSMVLARRGHPVSVYERRADMRAADVAAGRSINLIATCRGVTALQEMGLREVVLDRAAPVAGRMMHDVNGSLSFQQYGKDDADVNYSISRGELNQALMTEAETRGVRFHFQHRLQEMDLDGGGATFENEATGDSVEVSANRWIGADGSGSQVRSELERTSGIETTFTDLGHGYKELTIPQAEGGSFRAEKRALHIWPRGNHMMMALPNHDGSFTVTLYMPRTGDRSFESLSSPERVRSFFEAEFADSIPLIPDLEEEFFANPTGRLGTVRCQPWHVDDRALLIGDAAHAIVPFFGQGMNCGFEDCMVLDELLATHGDDWRTTFREFTERRKPNGDAIADMSLDNFVEMRDRVADPVFLLRKSVEKRLENELVGEYRSRYSIVAYSRVPYAVAQEAGRIQATILDELCVGLASAEDLDLAQAQALIRSRLAPFLAEHSVDLGF